MRLIARRSGRVPEGVFLRRASALMIERELLQMVPEFAAEEAAGAAVLLRRFSWLQLRAPEVLRGSCTLELISEEEGSEPGSAFRQTFGSD